MSTRAQIRFATREAGVNFNEHPNAIHAQFYVHSDGYPEGLGLEIAKATKWGKINGWEIENLDVKHGDLEYIYYIWQAKGKSTWISIFEVGWEQACECCGSIKTEDQWQDNCIFVGTDTDLVKKYDGRTQNK